MHKPKKKKEKEKKKKTKQRPLFNVLQFQEFRKRNVRNFVFVIFFSLHFISRYEACVCSNSSLSRSSSVSLTLLLSLSLSSSVSAAAAAAAVPRRRWLLLLPGSYIGLGPWPMFDCSRRCCCWLRCRLSRSRCCSRNAVAACPRHSYCIHLSSCGISYCSSQKRRILRCKRVRQGGGVEGERGGRGRGTVRSPSQTWLIKPATRESRNSETTTLQQDKWEEGGRQGEEGPGLASVGRGGRAHSGSPAPPHLVILFAWHISFAFVLLLLCLLFSCFVLFSFLF